MVMKTAQWIGACVLSAVLGLGLAQAQDGASTQRSVPQGRPVAQNIPINVRGFADMSCGAWASSSASPDVRASYVAWIVGFLSGFNFGNPHHQVGVGKQLSSETLALYVDKYCRDHPLGNIDGATFTLVKDLQAP